MNDKWSKGAILIWKEEYCIGIDLIDKQHKYLFEIGNNAYKLVISESSAHKYGDSILVLQDLHRYAKLHFQTEEEYMIKINYIDYQSQKLEHDEFVHKIDELYLELSDREDQESIDDIFAFICNWLLEHIMLKDKLIKPQ